MGSDPGMIRDNNFVEGVEIWRITNRLHYGI